MSETSTLFACTVLNDYAVFSQRWRSQYVSVICSFLTTFVLPLRSDEAVSVCARYLLCPLTTLVLSDKPVSVCKRYLLCPLTTLVLSNKPVSVCARYFFPNWCCQINQSQYVNVICYVFSQSWCCQINQSLYVYFICSKFVLSDKPVSVCARYLLCPLTTLVLSD